MRDRERIKVLTKRLEELEYVPASDWQRPILGVARDALRAEIRALAQTLVRRNYWRRAEPLPLGASGELA